jgi:hypothetical protein
MKMYTEPPFWEDILCNEPIFAKMVNNFNVIEPEMIRLHKFGKYLKLFFKYPVQKKDLKVKNKDWWIIEETTDWKLAPIFGAKHDALISRRTDKIKILAYDTVAFFIRKFICPKTVSLLKDGFETGKILNTSVPVLGPGAEIKPHKHPIKDHKHRMNYHLCITEDPEAYLTVGHETKTWKRGQILAFKNTGPYRHSVIHKGKNTRIVLMLELDVDYLEMYGVFRGERIKDVES